MSLCQCDLFIPWSNILVSWMKFQIKYTNEFLLNKNVLLRERKRHTDRGVSSTPYAVLSRGRVGTLGRSPLPLPPVNRLKTLPSPILRMRSVIMVHVCQNKIVDLKWSILPSQMKASVIFIHPMTKTVGMTTLPHLLAPDLAPSQPFGDLTVGTILEETQVTKIDGKRAVFFKLCGKIRGMASVSVFRTILKILTSFFCNSLLHSIVARGEISVKHTIWMWHDLKENW